MLLTHTLSVIGIGKVGKALTLRTIEVNRNVITRIAYGIFNQASEKSIQKELVSLDAQAV